MVKEFIKVKMVMNFEDILLMENAKAKAYLYFQIKVHYKANGSKVK